jgi:UDP-N-acetylglucosamine--N-acetylmuramyl-(pentapeptide) pyrophosphoryl-undecaprenol N-acetylglucosamine transferase
MKILVSTGASGGHISPALSFIDAIKESGPSVKALLVLPKRSLRSGLSLEGYDFRYICSRSLSFKSFFLFLAAFWQSAWIIFKFNPDIVVGFGTLDSLPSVLLGWFFRIRTMIHEQNVLPGEANKFLGRVCDRVAVSFKETLGVWRMPAGKAVLTGNPLRKGLRRIAQDEALEFFGLEKGKFTILVMGGSLGSRSINSAFLSCAAQLVSPESLQIIHITGTPDLASVGARYQELSIKSKIFAFLERIEYAYSASDLALCRAGAATISELIYFRLGALLIPYPFARRHQQANAEVLKDIGAALILPEEELNALKLSSLLNSIRLDAGAARMRLAYEGAGLPVEGAALRLAKEALAIL